MKSKRDETSGTPRDHGALGEDQLDDVVGGLSNQPFTPHSVLRLEDQLDPDEDPDVNFRRR